METTKKVKQVRENSRKSYTGKSGTTYIHAVSFEDDTLEYEYHSLSEKCTKFVAGQDATFNIGEDNYGRKKVTPIVQQKAPGFGGGKPAARAFEPKDSSHIAAQSVYSSTMNGLQGTDKVLDEKYVIDRCERAFQWIQSKATK